MGYEYQDNGCLENQAFFLQPEPPNVLQGPFFSPVKKGWDGEAAGAAHL